MTGKCFRARIIPLFALLLCLPCYLLLGFAGVDLVDSMDSDVVIETGLYKLGLDERERLARWFEFESQDYFLRLPRKVAHTDVNKVLTFTELLRPRSAREIPRIDERTVNWKWQLALCAVFRNEAVFLKEFIEFHRLQGIEHFYFYNNMSTDHYLSVLEPYIAEGCVELFELPVQNFVHAQSACYTDAVERCRGKSKWLILADTDIFHFAAESPNLCSFLASYDHPLIGGVVGNLCHFGTCGVSYLGDDDLLIDSCTKRKAEVCDHVRSIVKPHRVWRVDNPHWAHYLPEYFAVDEEFSRIAHHANPKRLSRKFKVNHYAFRTKEFLYNIWGLRHARFVAENKGRPLPTQVTDQDKAALDSIDASYCEVDDYSIQRFIEPLRRRLKNISN